jgi:hypothetical protein
VLDGGSLAPPATVRDGVENDPPIVDHSASRSPHALACGGWEPVTWKSTARAVVDRARLEREKWRLRRFYFAPRPGEDLERHLREAVAWLVRAQDHGDDRGVSYGTALGRGFLESYPETTGYIMQTFVRLAEVWNDPELLRRAEEMSDWEISIQLESGAVMGGRVTAEPGPAVFNTGQVLLGWAALTRRTGAPRAAAAARRAGRWLVSIQDPDGRWSRFNSRFARPESTVYNAKAAWGLGECGVVLGEESWLAAAARSAEYAVSRQSRNGWFADCCLSDPEHPLLHTLAYAMQGVLEVGVLARRDDLVEAARRTADSLIAAMSEDGYIPGRLNADFAPAADYCCLTGSAQTSIVWSRLHDLTGERRYRDAAVRVNRYLVARHDVETDDPTVRGGLTGSWPIHGEYGRFMVLNWATKFLVDALLAEQLGRS